MKHDLGSWNHGIMEWIGMEGTLDTSRDLSPAQVSFGGNKSQLIPPGINPSPSILPIPSQLRYLFIPQGSP